MRVETVKVQNPEDKDGGFMIINKSDYEADQKGEKKYKLYKSKDGDEEGAQDLDAPKATNRSGTFDEPTPSDIRFPNKDNTEFENNHGAFVGTDAAAMRESMGIDNRPGGVNPEVADEVKEAEEMLRSATARAADKTNLRTVRGPQGGGHLERRVPAKSKKGASDKSDDKADKGDGKGADDKK